MMMGKISVAALAGVTVALFANTITLTAAVCSNGLEGIQSTSLDVCCVEGCGVCGGVGCTPANTSALTAGDCCASEIVESGVFCDVSGVAPCIVTTAAADNSSVCINGQTGVQDPNTDVCCPLECGEFCGGEGCGTIPGVEASQCCAAAIMATGDVCSDTVLPPCTVVATATDNTTTCSNGLAGIEDSENLICCDAACGQCGGPGCGSIPGLTGLDCCSDEIAAVDQLCSLTGAAPCVVDPVFTPSMCPNGIAGVQDDTVCCAEACDGQCGGVGCGSIVGTNGASDCCSATILFSGVECVVGVVEAPCIMQNGTYTNAPAAAPTIPPPGTTLAPAAAGNATTTLAPVAAGNATTATEAPVAGSRDFNFTEAPTSAPTSAPTAAPGAAVTVTTTETPTGAPTSADGSRDIELETTPSPADTNGDGVVDANDGVDTNGDGVIDSNDGVDTNGDGIIDSLDGTDTNGDGVIDSNDGVDTNGDGFIDSQDGITVVSATPAPLSDADAEASGNGAMSAVNLPSSSVYAGVIGVAMTVGGMLLL